MRCVEGLVLKALYNFGNCQIPVFSLGVSQCMYKNNKPVWAQWSSNLQENNERKNNRVA